MRCADSYIVLRGLSMSHRPPTPDDASYPSTSMPRCCRARAAARPEGPAPMTAYLFMSLLHGAVRFRVVIPRPCGIVSMLSVKPRQLELGFTTAGTQSHVRG